jgi:diadenosine tetraphosphatase ApaH/serine/threonine PP2A family protein phosphatase
VVEVEDLLAGQGQLAAVGEAPKPTMPAGEWARAEPVHAARVSVGQPRDFDSRSCYVIYDTDTQTVSLVRVYYDFTITQRKIRSNHLPLFLAERLEKGR